MVTFAALLRLRAADNPPGPAPTITTLCSSGDEGHSMQSIIAMLVFCLNVQLHMPMVNMTMVHETCRFGICCLEIPLRLFGEGIMVWCVDVSSTL